MAHPKPANFAEERQRMERMLGRFLVPKIPPGARVLSIGCGMGSDVLELRKRGFEAYGLDPSRLSFEYLPARQRGYFRVGTIESLPFGERKFDFAYALDVIEHVGCKEFGTVVTPETPAVRIKFIEACLKTLSPGGTLLLTTSNRLCPIDPGHWHRYHWLGRLMKTRRKFGISIPWSKKNFLVSLGDVRKLVSAVDSDGTYEVALVPAAQYPNMAEGKSAASRVVATILRLLDKGPLPGSPLNPQLVVRIARKR